MQDEDKPEKIKKWDSVDGVGGDDPLDSCGHGIHHFKEVEKVMPKSYFISERIEHIQADYEEETGHRITDPNRLIMIHQTQAARYDRTNPVGGGRITFPRASSNRHRNRVN